MRADERNDLILSGVTVAFALLVMFVVIPLGVEDPGKINVLALGPSFWPFIIALFICLMGLIVGVQAFRRYRAGGNPRMAAGGQRFALARWAGALVLLAGYYVLLGLLGMVVTSILALLLFMLLGGERRPALIAAISLILPITLYLFFRYVANVAIPMGIFGDWIA